MIGRLRMPGNLRRIFVSSMGLVLLAQGMNISAQTSEAGLRVAFLYNFLKFIEWPELQGKDLLLCALGARDTTRQSLFQLDNKRTLATTIKVLFLDQVDGLEQQLGQCQLVYVPATGAEMPLPTIIPAGILLVMDEADVADERVGIALHRNRDDRIEFSVNEAALKHARVKVSSQLLKLARNKPGGPT